MKDIIEHPSEYSDRLTTAAHGKLPIWNLTLFHANSIIVGRLCDSISKSGKNNYFQIKTQHEARVLQPAAINLIPAEPLK